MIENIQPQFITDTPIAIEIFSVNQVMPHRHPNSIELLYCLYGNAYFVMDHERSTISSGELVTIEHSNIHFLESDEDNLFISLHIDMKKTFFNWDAIKYYYFSCSTKYCLSHQKNAMEHIIDILLSAAYLSVSCKHKTLPSAWSDTADSLMTILIDNFLWFAVEDLTSEENKKFRERLIDILTYTQQNFRDKITIKQLAAMEYINENYLSQFLKRTSFHSFTFMLNYVRCFEAQDLLLNTDRTVQEISDECGFSSKKYLHRFFKHYWNTTPLQLRKSYREYIAKHQNDVCNIPDSEAEVFLKEYITERYIRNALHSSKHGQLL